LVDSFEYKIAVHFRHRQIYFFLSLHPNGLGAQSVSYLKGKGPFPGVKGGDGLKG